MSPPPLTPDALIDAFALQQHHYVYLIGGGGKTSLMLALAGALSSRGHSVVATTSTKLGYSQVADAAEVVIEDEPAALAAKLRRSLDAPRPIVDAPRPIVAGKSRIESGAKIGGFTPHELDHLRGAVSADYWLVEGDGSAGRSLKAHLDHEPVISAHADLVIAVVGIDCVGKPLTEEFVHRAERLRSLLHRAGNAPISIDDVANVIVHPRGYLAKAGPGSAIAVFISKAGTAAQRYAAQRLGKTLRAADTARRIDRIVIGELCQPPSCIDVYDPSRLPDAGGH